MVTINKRKLVAVFLLLLIAASFSTVLETVSAIVIPPDPNLPPGPRLRILSPENTTYSLNSIIFTFTLWLPSQKAVAPGTYVYPVSWILKYYLDGQQIGQLTGGKTELDKSFSITLKTVSEGLHTIKVFGTAFWEPSYGYAPGESVVEQSFAIDTTAPNIQVFSTQEAHYDVPNLSFNFSVSQDASWIGYSLDNKDNVTFVVSSGDPIIFYGQIRHSLMLAGLAEGSHNLTVYAADEAGNIGKSDTIKFYVASQPTTTPSPYPSPTLPPTTEPTLEPTIEPTIEPTQTPSPTVDDDEAWDLTLIIVLSGIAVAAIAVLALIFLRRRKQ